MFSPAFPVVETEVSLIVDVQTSCLSSHARRFSPFLENNMPPFFILDVCIFKFGSKPPISLIVPPLSLIVPPLSLIVPPLSLIVPPLSL